MPPPEVLQKFSLRLHPADIRMLLSGGRSGSHSLHWRGQRRKQGSETLSQPQRSTQLPQGLSARWAGDYTRSRARGRVSEAHH